MMLWHVEAAEVAASVAVVADFTVAVGEPTSAAGEAAARMPDVWAAADTGMPEDHVPAIRLPVAPVLVDQAIP